VIAHSEQIARSIGFDLVEAGWAPTVENYLGRVTKARIVQAVRESKGEETAQMIGHLKKADMAREAARLMEGSGWLPEPLRPTVDEAAAGNSVDVEVGEIDAGDVEEAGAELPAFLADGEEEAAEDDADLDEERHLDAAE
jgi:ParB family chromosome partitioning protein